MSEMHNVEKYRWLVERTVKTLIAEDNPFEAAVASIGAAIGVIEIVRGKAAAQQIASGIGSISSADPTLTPEHSHVE